MNKQILASLISIIAIAGVFIGYNDKSSNKDLFTEWRQKFGFTFDDEQMTYRYNVFTQNLAKINQHNSRLGRGHEQGLNQFAFLTQQQFRAQYLSSFNGVSSSPVVEQVSTQVNGPTVDWVTYGAVSPVKNQGSCTATYAFSAIGAVEGLSVIFYKTQQQYSVQQLIDCSQPYGNAGCTTGRMDFSFNYIRDKGINTWAAYPYTGIVGTCQTGSGLFKVGGYTNVTDCTTLANALTVRPISVAVDGNNFQFYKSGVFYNCSTNLSLAVLLVGMTDSFWVLKNSWGTAWGESGYIRIARGNTCGVCQAGSYPFVK